MKCLLSLLFYCCRPKCSLELSRCSVLLDQEPNLFFTLSTQTSCRPTTGVAQTRGTSAMGIPSVKYTHNWEKRRAKLEETISWRIWQQRTIYRAFEEEHCFVEWFDGMSSNCFSPNVSGSAYCWQLRQCCFSSCTVSGKKVFYVSHTCVSHSCIDLFHHTLYIFF